MFYGWEKCLCVYLFIYLSLSRLLIYHASYLTLSLSRFLSLSLSLPLSPYLSLSFHPSLSTCLNQWLIVRLNYLFIRIFSIHFVLILIFKSFSIALNHLIHFVFLLTLLLTVLTTTPGIHLFTHASSVCKATYLLPLPSLSNKSYKS